MANTNCFLPYPLQGEIHYLFSWDTSSESFEFLHGYSPTCDPELIRTFL